MQVYVEHLHFHRDYLTIEMGKAGKWLKQILTGKKEKERVSYSKYIPVETKSGPIVMGPPIPEKKRWSFRRSVTGAKPEMEKKSAHVRRCSDSEMYQKRQVTVVRAADANAAVIRRTSRAAEAVLEVAAIKIQSIFRSYLARKALSALRGLVKLQALIRGQLVRRQTAATLRSMQAMAAAQARARLQMIQMYEEAQDMSHFNQKIHRRSLYEMEEKIKIVEMDLGVSKRSSNSRSSYSYSVSTTPYRRELIQEFSPARSSITEKSPRAYKDDFVGQLSNLYMNNNSGYPNYMAKTESSKAKVRSVSAPKQRDDASERTRRSSIDGRSVPRGVANMQRSTSPSSYVSVQESECGSTSGVLMNTKYCRPLKAYEICSELS